MADKIPSKKLNSGHEMPMLGMGTWHHGPKNEIQDALRFAIRNGYRHIDGAHIYLNEEEVGEVYDEMINKNKEIKREELFIASKLWSTHHRPEHVEEALRASLKKLNLDYLDVYYIHWPASFKYGSDNLPKDADGRIIHTDDDYVETWKALEEMVNKGLTRSLAVCNFNTEQLKRLLANCKIPPAALQIECNPRIQNDILRRFCEKHNIAMVAYSPFGSPDLPWGEKLPHLLLDPVLKEIADKHGRSTASVVLRWNIHRGIAVIPKSIIESELAENLKLNEFTLDDSDLAKIAGLERNLRKIIPVVTLKDGSVEKRDQHSKFYPFNAEETEANLN